MKKRDLKFRLAILVVDKLPLIRFTLNTAKSDSTGQSAAFLQFQREFRTLDDVKHDVKIVIENDNFVPEITPYLKRFARNVQQVRKRVKLHEDKQKKYADNKKQQASKFTPGDKDWIILHPVSKGSLKKTNKFIPKRDGTDGIISTTFEIVNLNEPDKILGQISCVSLKNIPRA